MDTHFRVGDARTEEGHRGRYLEPVLHFNPESRRVKKLSQTLKPQLIRAYGQKTLCLANIHPD